MRPASLAAAAALALAACGKEDGGGRGKDAQGGTAAVARARAEGFYRPPDDRIPSRLATNPGTPWGDYVGSARCLPCHAEEHAGWRSSFHAKTLYDAVPETVFGDFGGDSVARDPLYPFTARAFRVGDRMYMEVHRNAGWRPPRPSGRGEDTYGAGVPAEPSGTWEIVYAFGNRRHQPYVAKDRAGRHWVLPFFWNDVTRTWRYSGWRPYASACANCHVTGIKSLAEPQPGSLPIPMTVPQRFTPPPAEEGWAEGAVSCEICHGPGRRHAETAEQMGVAGYRAWRADPKNPKTIFCPSDLTPEGRMKQCDSCHNFMAESPVTYVPGPDGYDHEMLFRPIRPDMEDDGHQFYPDGTDRSPCTVGRVFRGSKMGRTGRIECRTCHDSHGNSDWADLRASITDNALCVGCHEGTHADLGDPARLTAHTRHPADGPGSRCVECHMRRDKQFTNGIEVMSDQLFSHDFGSPTGHEPPGSPGPSCIVCHADKDTAWVRETLEAWRRDGWDPSSR
jgi:predicted CXXCH cytochrome family protein